MKTLNCVHLIGFLGADPKHYALPSGMPVSQFHIATHDVRYDKVTHATIEKTEWHSIRVFDRLADVANRFLQKGAGVYIEGRIQSREYEDKTEHITKKIIDIIAEDLIILSGGKPEWGASQKNTKGGDA